VRGGPGTSAEIAAKGFTSGFGNLAGNVALLDDLRALNQHQPPARQIGIIGVDMSLGGPFGSAPTMAAVTCALDGVRDSALREDLQASFAKAVLPGLTRTDVSDQAKADFRNLARRLAASVDPAAPASVQTCLRNVEESAAVLDALPKPSAGHSIPADAWRSVSARDDAMAANALAALDEAGGKSILLFAHARHILSAPMRGGQLSGLTQPPESMGEVLRRKLGSRYVAVVQIEPVAPPPSDAPPDLLSLLRPACADTCIVSPAGLRLRQVRVGLNGDDQEIVDPLAAAAFYLVIPKKDQAAGSNQPAAHE
jgi:erythromycin esterase-like protein